MDNTFLFNSKQSADTLVQQETIVNNDSMGMMKDYFWMLGVGLQGQYGLYQIESVLAEGGEAIVFLANNNGWKYVIKYYVNVRRMATDKRERFISLLLNQTSPYIVPLVDYGEFEHKLFDVYPYIENGNLAERNVSLEFIRDVVIPNVNEALKLIHSYNIAHRDIKPNNILLSNDGKSVMLNDFSIMSVVEENTGGVYTETAFRTNGYASPEILMMMPCKMSDYYAFGITLLSLLNGGINLFQNMDEATIYGCTVNGNIPRLDKGKFAKMSGKLLSLQERIEGLICGLTIYDHQKRWGYEEVVKWCNGEIDYPEMEDEVEERDFDVPFLARTGEKLYTLSELANYLVSNWENSKKDLISGVVTNWLAAHRPDKAVVVNEMLEHTHINNGNNTQDVSLFKTIYLLDNSFPYFCWKGKLYADFSNLAEDMRNTAMNIDEVFENQLFTWFLCNNSNMKGVDQNIISLFEDIERKRITSIKIAQNIFMLQFLPTSYPRGFVLRNEFYNDAKQIVYKIMHVSDVNRYCKELLTSSEVAAWMYVQGYDEVYSNASMNVHLLKEEEFFTRVVALLEVIVDDKSYVQKLVLQKGSYAHIYWLRNHLNEYEYTSEEAIRIKNRILSKNIDNYLYATDLYNALKELEEDYSRFEQLLYNMPFHIACGVLCEDSTKSIIPKTSAAAFMYKADNNFLPAGYVHESGIREECLDLSQSSMEFAASMVKKVYTNISNNLNQSSERLDHAKNTFHSNNNINQIISIILAIVVIVLGFFRGLIYGLVGIVGAVFPVFCIFNEIKNSGRSALQENVEANLNAFKESINKWKDSTTDELNKLRVYYLNDSSQNIFFDMNQYSYYYDYMEKSQNAFMTAELEYEQSALEKLLFCISSFSLAVLIFCFFESEVADFIVGQELDDYAGVVYGLVIMIIFAGMMLNFFLSVRHEKNLMFSFLFNPLFGLMGLLVVGIAILLITIAGAVIEALAEIVIGILTFVIIFAIIFAVIFNQ